MRIDSSTWFRSKPNSVPAFTYCSNTWYKNADPLPVIAVTWCRCSSETSITDPNALINSSTSFLDLGSKLFEKLIPVTECPTWAFVFGIIRANGLLVLSCWRI